MLKGIYNKLLSLVSTSAVSEVVNTADMIKTLKVNVSTLSDGKYTSMKEFISFGDLQTLLTGGGGGGSNTGSSQVISYIRGGNPNGNTASQGYLPIYVYTNIVNTPLTTAAEAIKYGQYLPYSGKVRNLAARQYTSSGSNVNPILFKIYKLTPGVDSIPVDTGVGITVSGSTNNYTISATEYSFNAGDMLFLYMAYTPVSTCSSVSSVSFEICKG
jgi:hypothetical protein